MNFDSNAWITISSKRNDFMKQLCCRIIFIIIMIKNSNVSKRSQFSETVPTSFQNLFHNLKRQNWQLNFRSFLHNSYWKILATKSLKNLPFCHKRSFVSKRNGRNKIWWKGGLAQLCDRVEAWLCDVSRGKPSFTRLTKWQVKTQCRWNDQGGNPYLRGSSVQWNNML